MKKLFVYVLVVLFIIPSVVLGYEAEKYSIDIPEGYEATLIPNSFTDENGNNINVQLTEETSGTVEFTEAYLDALTKELTDNIDEYREEVKNQLVEQYNGQVEESVIEGVVQSIQYKEFIKKEIITFGQDDYLGFHYISDISILDGDSYTDTYQTVYNDYVYTITVTSTDLETFNSDAVKKAIESFKINGYVAGSEEAKLIDTNTNRNEKSSTDKFFYYGAIVVAVVGIIGMISKAKSGKKKDEE